MLFALLIWAYASPMPFAWARVFFGLRGHRGLAARWLIASISALTWPLFWTQYALWRRHHPAPIEPVSDGSLGDQIATEFRTLYP